MRASLLIAGLAAGLTACSAAPSVTITAAGDYGAGPTAAQVLQSVGAIGPDAHLAVGDLSYGQVPPQEWCGFVADAVGPTPVQVVAGNHETPDYPGSGEIESFAQCLPNSLPATTGDYGREYWTDLPAQDPLVRVIAISPALNFAAGRWDYRDGDPHSRWTADAIESARAAGIPWIVVAAHIPCWSLGVHSCPDPDDVYQLLIDEGVDLVIHGHEHSYARTHQLGGPSCPQLTPDSFRADCVADSDDEYRAGAGTVFATVGTGGIALRESRADDPEIGYFAAHHGAGAAHGVLRIDATPQRLQAAFVATDGSTGDRFAIARAAPAAGQPVGSGATRHGEVR